jgi:thiol-disulfide isomerase/thioredoxin
MTTKLACRLKPKCAKIAKFRKGPQSTAHLQSVGKYFIIGQSPFSHGSVDLPKFFQFPSDHSPALYRLQDMRPSILSILCLCLAAGCSPRAEQTPPRPKPVFDKQPLKDFVLSTGIAAVETSLTGLDLLLNKAAGDSVVFRQTANYLETPLGDPNSRFRNERLQIRLLEKKLSTTYYIAAEREAMEKRLDLIKQNPPGGKANDFAFYSPAGVRDSLYHIKREYTLLFFYNPDCPACKEFKTALLAMPRISQLERGRRLAIVAIYTDTDLSIWKKALPQLPKSWIHGCDREEVIYKSHRYDLHAIPTAYLLDKDKTVLCKDCTPSEIESRVP